METKQHILKFEGAGWDGAEHNGVGNCRIRTRIKNKRGDIIYFECTSLKKNGEFKGFVSHCFNIEDEISNHTKELAHIERLQFKYNTQDLIKFVNEHLDCDFTELEVYNEGLRVHDTKEALCSCYEGVL